MKNLLFLFFFLVNTFFISAQVPCKGSFFGEEFNGNKFQTYFLPQGHKFQAYGNYGLNILYPFPEKNKFVEMIATGAPWIGSFTDGRLYMAGQTYISDFNNDFYTGPLDSNGMKYLDECHLYDRAWNVFTEDVLRHTIDYQADNKIEDTIASIFSWPGEGNPFFLRFNGFEFPSDHKGGWAPFADLNNNGIYEPNLGEYPAVYLKGVLTHPAQIMWMVFNDQGSHLNTNGLPLGVEIQLTVFGYYCQNNALLNQSLFNSYKIINQSGQGLDSLFFGTFHDYHIGCSEDDYVGCDTLRNTEFGYNQDELDGNDGSFCTSGAVSISQHTPIQSFTYLSHPMYSFIKQTMLQTPQTDIEHFRMTTGRWRAGHPITIGGNGQATDPELMTTRYLYHGDPRVPGSWSELTVGEPSHRTQTISSVKLQDLQPGDQVTVEGVYIFSLDTTRSHLEQFDVMHENLDLMDDMLSDMDSYCEGYPVCLDGDCVWPGDFNRDGIADQRDLLHWATSIGASGSERNGLISWRGHFSEDWTMMLEDGTNAKHLDANGDGMIDFTDLEMNIDHYLNTTPDYKVNDRYPGGPEIMIVAEPMDEEGNIGDIRVISRRPLKDMYGIAFELEFDTFYYDYSTLLHRLPLDTLGLTFIPGENHHPPYYSFYKDSRQGDTRYSFVGINQENYSIPDGFTFMRIPFGLKNQHQVPLPYLPDQFVLRLKNLTGINKDGEDLEFGSVPLIVYNPFTTSVDHPEIGQVKVFPNPCHDQLMIVAEYSSDVDIVDLHGRKVRTLEASSISIPIDVSDLVAGMYVLRFLQSGNVVKLIVQ